MRSSAGKYLIVIIKLLNFDIDMCESSDFFTRTKKTRRILGNSTHTSRHYTKEWLCVVLPSEEKNNFAKLHLICPSICANQQFLRFFLSRHSNHRTNARVSPLFVHVF